MIEINVRLFNNNDNDNNNKTGNDDNNKFKPIPLKFQVGIQQGIALPHGKKGLLSLGWQPVKEKENSDVKPG